MLPSLTDRQKAIYDFLLQTIREKGFAPSIHEIGRQFKIAFVKLALNQSIAFLTYY